VITDRSIRVCLAVLTLTAGYKRSVLPSDRPTGPLRRLLHYVGLANASDDRLRRANPPAPRATDDTEREERRAARRAALDRGTRTALVYFGLADDPERDRKSRYGEVSSTLDRDVDALRARVAELETRLEALTQRE
jgi:hypothetical protein